MVPIAWAWAPAQMTGGGASVVLGPSDPDTWHPDLDWLERELTGPRPPKLVYVVSPGNPTGAPPTAFNRKARVPGNEEARFDCNTAWQ